MSFYTQNSNVFALMLILPFTCTQHWFLFQCGILSLIKQKLEQMSKDKTHVIEQLSAEVVSLGGQVKTYKTQIQTLTNEERTLRCHLVQMMEKEKAYLTSLELVFICKNCFLADHFFFTFCFFLNLMRHLKWVELIYYGKIRANVIVVKRPLRERLDDDCWSG